jgi:hypothetical protein
MTLVAGIVWNLCAQAAASPAKLRSGWRPFASSRIDRLAAAQSEIVLERARLGGTPVSANEVFAAVPGGRPAKRTDLIEAVRPDLDTPNDVACRSQFLVFPCRGVWLVSGISDVLVSWRETNRSSDGLRGCPRTHISRATASLRIHPHKGALQAP